MTTADSAPDGRGAAGRCRQPSTVTISLVCRTGAIVV